MPRNSRKKNRKNNKKNNGWQLAYELEGAAFGAADGVICILGLIFGVAIATQNTTLILIAALAGGVADAFGNSIGFFISQSTERGVQIQRKKGGEVTHVHTKQETILNSVFSFIATLIVLGILLFPFILFSIGDALIMTTALGVLILFFLGIFVAKLTGENQIKTAAIFILLGISGAAVGYFIGSLFKIS